MNRLRPCYLLMILSFISLSTHAETETASAVPALENKAEQEATQSIKKRGFWDKWFGKKGEEQEQIRELTPKYPIEIQTDNEEVRAMLSEHLPLIKEQRHEELDKEQIEFLLEDAPKNALAMLKTEGYFNAKVQIVPKEKGYVLRVDLGERTRIDNVSLMLLGEMLRDENLSSYYKNSFANWTLPVGAPFRQADWSSTKASVLTAVTRKKYPLARFTATRATVNPETKTAELLVNVDSNRPIYFGDLHITGTERYPVAVVQGLAQFKAGDVYDLDKILDYQQALENDNHYSGASVQADFDHIQGDRVPIKVAVSEVKRQKIEVGLRFDSEYGLGGHLGYDHHNLFNRGYMGSVHLDQDKYQSTLALGISQPRNGLGYYHTANAAYSRNTTQRLEKRTLSTGLWRVRDKDGRETRLGIEFVGEEATIPNHGINLGRSYATMLTASWKRQNIETTLRPANGYYLDGKIGVTLGKVLSSAAIMRVKTGAGYYFTPEEKKWGTFIARGELGYVHANKNDAIGDVPSSLMFRTGGASSIRGYELDSIGQVLSDGTVLPDRAMVVFSTEYQIPVKKDFALALFHDMGGTARTFQKMHWRHGSGLGVRWFSPVAPFSFDIAYGHHDRKIRWHISLGTRF